MKRNIKLVSIALGMLMVFSMLFAACADPHEGKTVISFWGATNPEESAVFTKMVQTFNDTNTDNIYVDYDPKGGDYETLIDRTLATSKGPDVFYVEDKVFKKWARLGYLENIQKYVDESDLELDRIWDSAVQRYRYGVENNTNNADDPLYGLPKDISPTALYYNKSVFENHGIKVISVDEKDLDAYNAGTKAGNDGKTKAEAGIPSDFTVPAQGFYRQYPYTSGGRWRVPEYSNKKTTELMIFNNRIPMDWDQVEDLAMMFTKKTDGGLKYNDENLSAKDPTWGYFTEWWFSYGWSVGGDCAEDTTGNGDWVFTLGDKDTRKVVYNKDGSYAYGVDGKNLFVKTKDEAEFLKSNEHIVEGCYLGPELPSQYDAFTRFVRLSQDADKGGLGITPTPKDIGSSSSVTFFATGRVAMLVERNFKIPTLRKTIGNTFDWDVAPLPKHKDGIEIGHSNSTAFAIWTKSKVKDEAFQFIEFMAGETAQKIQANGGFNLCNQKDIAQTEYVDYNVKNGQKPQNIKVFTEYGDIQRPGDWWYMPDKDWISEWSVALNTPVRNGEMSIDEFFKQVTDKTNVALAGYKQK